MVLKVTVVRPPPGFSPWATLKFRRAAPGLSRPVTFVPTERRLVVESTDRHLRRCDGRRRHTPQCVARFFCPAPPPAFRIQRRNACPPCPSHGRRSVHADEPSWLAIEHGRLIARPHTHLPLQTRSYFGTAMLKMAAGRVRCTSRAHPCCSVLQRARPLPQLAARLHHPP